MGFTFQSLLEGAGAPAPAFSSHWAPTAAGRVHFLDEGPMDGAPPDPQQTLLFVHGNPTWCFHWRGLIEAFRGRYRCVAPDHLGCGLSDAPAGGQTLAQRTATLVELIDHLDLQRVTLVAQDWGGAIGLGALFERPQRFQGVVLFNTGAFPPPRTPWRIAACKAPVVGRLALQGLNLFSLAAVRMTTHRGPLPRGVARGYLAPYRSWSRRRAVADFVADIPWRASHPTYRTLSELERRLPSLSALPSALVWGMRDWCFTPACLERFERAWPQAQVTRLADAGHWVVEDAPDECRRAVDHLLGAPTLRGDGVGAGRA